MRSRGLLVAVLVPALLAMAEGKPDCVGKPKEDGTCSTTTGQTGSGTAGGGATGEPSEMPTQTRRTDTETGSVGGGQPSEPPGRSAEGTTQNDASETSRRPKEDTAVLGEVIERRLPGQVDADGSGGNDGAGAPGDPATSGESAATGAATQTAAVPPPAGIRYLTARLLSGADLEVLVNENRVRGIDGGWAVVVAVQGGSLVPEAVTTTGHGGISRMLLPSGPGQPVTLLAVSGQRSPESYDARYRAIGQLDLSSRPVITITLIQ